MHPCKCNVWESTSSVGLLGFTGRSSGPAFFSLQRAVYVYVDNNSTIYDSETSAESNFQIVYMYVQSKRQNVIL